MEPPYTIASVASPLDIEHGRIRAAPVYGVKESRKRKRHEVAVGVDGEGVNVYNISNQSQVASYALPPQSYLCCPPCSVYIRRPKPAGPQRRTYLVLRDSPQSSSKTRLACSTEDVEGSRRDVDASPTPKKQERKVESGDITSLEAIPGPASDTDAGLQVVICYRNGRLQCFDSSLTAMIWERDSTSKTIQLVPNQPYEVEHTGLTDVDTARNGLLAGREDVLAALETSQTGSATNQQLLYRAVRLDVRRSLQIFSLRTRSRDATQSHKSDLEHLVTIDLPSTSDSLKAAEYEVHAATGKVYQLIVGRLTIFDLSTTIPRVVTSFGSRGAPVISFGRISGSAVMAVQADKATVYETRYGSEQASAIISGAGLAVGQKRKREDDEANVNSWQIVTTFQDLGIIAGLDGSELKAMQLSEDMRKPKRAALESTSLAEVIGQGAIKPSSKASKWRAWTERVDAVFSADDVSEIEKIAASVLQLRLEKQAALKDGSQMNGDHDMELAEPESEAVVFDTAQIDQSQVLYLLSKLFRAVPEDEASAIGRLATTARSETVYEWLVLTGYLTVQHVQRALRTHHGLDGAATLQPGDIMSALKNFDDTFELVHDLLQDQLYWDVAELVQALSLLIQSFETPAEGAVKALPAPPQHSAAQTNGDTAMVNGDAEFHAKSEALMAERELDLAISALANGLQLRSETLRLVLGRLEAFPPSTVTHTMRTMMKQDELIFFLKIMRIELLQGGWHQRYVVLRGDEDEEYEQRRDDEVAPSDRAMAQISWLMNCAIDAIGISGFVVGQSGDAHGTYKFLEELKAETSAALEGLFENESLKVKLEEVQRYQFSKEQADLAMLGMSSEIVPEEEKLPVGCKVDAAAPSGKMAKAGKKKRRDLAIERRAQVGKYVFERIRI